MKYKKCFQKCCIISFFLMLSGFSSGAVKFYQSSKVHNDGSIIMTFTYSAKETDVKNNLVGNLPFAIEDVKQFFYSPVSEIKKSLTYKDPSDSSISSVTIDIVVRDINKIPEIKGLSDFKTVWMKTDTGMVFTLLIPVSFIQTNFIDTYQFILSFEDKIKSTNGVVKDNICNWYVYRDKINPGGAYFVSTVTATENNHKTTPPSEEGVKSNGSGTSDDGSQKSNEGSESSGDDKSDKGVKQNERGKFCGLFSIELPIIIFCGLIISYNYRKRKTR